MILLAHALLRRTLDIPFLANYEKIQRDSS
jgi:hypothetical protein